MNHSKLFFVLLVTASAASAQVQVPVQGVITDAGVGISGNRTLEFRLVDDGATALTCESQTLDLEAGFFSALLGSEGAADCGGGEVTTLTPELFTQPLSLEVSLGDGTVLGLFPVGDAPRAGFARLATRLVDELPAVVRAPDSAALLAALQAAGSAPTVIELGAGSYGLPGGTVVPPLTDLRGLGSVTTLLTTDGLTFGGNNRVSGVGFRSAAPDGVALILRPPPGAMVELIDITLLHVPASGAAFGVVIDQNADATSRVILRDSELILQASNEAVGLVDQRGVVLELVNTTIRATGSGLVAGIRLGVPGTDLPTTNTRIVNSRLEISSSGGFTVGLESFLDAGVVRVLGTQVRVIGTNGRAISANGGDIRVTGSLLFSDVPLFSLAAESLKVSGTGIESFRGTIVDPTSAVVQCVDTYNEATFAPVACN